MSRTKAAIKAPSGPAAQAQIAQGHTPRRRPNPVNRIFPKPTRLTWEQIKNLPGPTPVASIDPKHQPRPYTPNRSYSAGMTVLHRTRMRPLPADHPARKMPRPDVMRRVYIRGLRAQGITVIDEAKTKAAA